MTLSDDLLQLFDPVMVFAFMRGIGKQPWRAVLELCFPFIDLCGVDVVVAT